MISKTVPSNLELKNSPKSIRLVCKKKTPGPKIESWKFLTLYFSFFECAVDLGAAIQNQKTSAVPKIVVPLANVESSLLQRKVDSISTFAVLQVSLALVVLACIYELQMWERRVLHRFCWLWACIWRKRSINL